MPLRDTGSKTISPQAHIRFRMPRKYDWAADPEAGPQRQPFPAASELPETVHGRIAQSTLSHRLRSGNHGWQFATPRCTVFRGVT